MSWVTFYSNCLLWKNEQSQLIHVAPMGEREDVRKVGKTEARSSYASQLSAWLSVRASTEAIVAAPEKSGSSMLPDLSEQERRQSSTGSANDTGTMLMKNVASAYRSE